MSTGNTLVRSLVLSVVICLAVAVVVTLLGASRPSEVRDEAGQLARGKYLVENVAMCQDCHTPRKENGELDASQWLQGTSLDFAPLHPMPWADVGPSIAGLPTMETPDAIRLFQTGLMSNGKPLLPPMPQYKLTRDDAEAVVVYLQSLGD